MSQTIEQLKNRSWPTFIKAADAIKAAGFPVKGEDYEVREAVKGSFQIMPIEAAGAKASEPEKAEKAPFTITIAISKTQKVEETARTLVGAIRKRNAMNVEHGKMGMRPKILAVTADGTGVVQLGPWTTMAKAEAAMKDAGLPMSGPEYDIRERAKGSVSLAFLPSPSDEPVPPAKAATASTTKAGQKKGAAKTSAKKADVEVPKVEPVQPKADDEPANDMTALPQDGGPYILRIAHWPQHDIPGGALKASLAMGEPVMIVDKSGKVVRTIDGRLAKPKARAAKAGGGQRKSAGLSAPATSPSVKAKLVEALLAKPLTSPQVRAITKWDNPKMSMRNAVSAIAAEAGHDVKITPVTDAGKATLQFRFTKRKA